MAFIWYVNNVTDHKKIDSIQYYSAEGAPILLILYQSSICLFALQYIIGRVTTDLL